MRIQRTTQQQLTFCEHPCQTEAFFRPSIGGVVRQSGYPPNLAQTNDSLKGISVLHCWAAWKMPSLSSAAALCVVLLKIFIYI